MNERNYQSRNACENCQHCNDIGDGEGPPEYVCALIPDRPKRPAFRAADPTGMDAWWAWKSSAHVAASGICDEYQKCEKESYVPSSGEEVNEIPF
ncbi:MAG: hypothetical protein ACO24O_08100 [Arenimonas sp.]